MDHQPSPTPLVSAARDVAVAAAEAAPAAERARRLDPDVVKAVVAAGFARHFVPVECGGSLGSFLDLTRAVSALGEGCAATAWCASLSAHVSRMAAHLPAEGYREIWADGPDVLVVGSLTPMGTAEPVPGGYRLSGQWPFVSAIDHAEWALLAANVAREHGPEPRVFAVPRSAWRTVDTWHNVGMAATGSNTVIVEDVFVPEARTMRRDDLFAGRAVDSAAACHALPMQATTLMFVTPALGAAKGAFAGWVKHITPKIAAAAKVTAAPLPGMPRFNRTSHDVTLARTAAEIDAAEMLLERASEVADLGRAVTPYLTMRNWRDCAQVTDMLITVVNRLFRGMGTTGQTTGNPVQRFWRDVNSLAGHQGLQFESAATAYSHEVIAL
ncbi:acyl-CoA dehydrogenase family protein [Actinokineospora iranica]|uniref:Two-component flavin-dependent monooxygenase/oxygenase LndZ5 n=1 Tax=Actinokineospora iranica TaxID=1271860 RepID=A0A1G6S5R9_9PSEU|nr:acyl-CoA dehydrogenase family protein [Actinokineospora iranica]SDD12282.1 two-component flavin-dependent monooxygenase/oxygenase LndZ5 [Actinokineospora iranica]